MELFRLFGKIAVENATANKSIDETTDKAERAQGKLSGALGKLGAGAAKIGTVAAVAGAAVASAAVTATTAVTKMAVSAYADFEQLVGGVNTLFGESTAKKVQENAAKAFSTAGLSANQYMETVTSFSASLLQSVGGDTEKAAEIADRAIIDMADNANKMGTSMEMIQNAYQGFAKQNYTMLDNLKLGYGGTKEEMARLIEDASRMTDVQKELGITVDAGSMSFDNIANAISVVQANMGIAGATYDEAATTISGSVASMKAAWQNFLVGLADGNMNMDALTQNLATSVATVGRNLVPRVITTVKSIGTVLVNNLRTHGGDAVDTLGKALSSGLPKLVSRAGELIVGFGNALKNNFPAIVQKGVELIGNLVAGILRSLPQILSAGVKFIASLGTGIANAVPALISSVGTIGNNLVQGLWNGIGNAKEWVLNKIKGFGKDILNGLKSFFGIHSPSKVMEEQVGKNLALGVAQGISKNTDKVDEAAEEMGSRIMTAANQTLKEYKRIHKMSIGEEVAYWAEIVKQTKKGTQARIDAEDKYYEALEEQQRQIQEAEEEAAKKREEQLEQYKKELEDFQEAHKDFVEQVMDQTDLFDPFKISDSGVTGADLIANLQSQVDGLINYAEIMESLEDKLSGTALLEKLKEFGTDSLAELQAINSMTEAQLDEYVKLYDQKYSLANAQAEGRLGTSSKLASINNAIQSVYNSVAKKAYSIGGISYDPNTDYKAEIDRLTAQGAPADVIYSYEKKRAAKIVNEGIDANSVGVSANESKVIELLQGILDKPSNTYLDGKLISQSVNNNLGVIY